MLYAHTNLCGLGNTAADKTARLKGRGRCGQQHFISPVGAKAEGNEDRQLKRLGRVGMNGIIAIAASLLPIAGVAIKIGAC